MRLAERAKIALLAADGLENRQIAEQLHISRFKAARWAAKASDILRN